jgi:hypothetical protein
MNAQLSLGIHISGKTRPNTARSRKRIFTRATNFSSWT